MELSKKELDQMFEHYADKAAKKAAKEAAREVAKESDTRMRQYLQETKEENKHYRDDLKQENKDHLAIFREETERYLGALKEDFDHKLDIVLEILPDLQRKVDLTFDKVGEIATDDEVLKEIVKDHEQRLQKLEVS